MGAHELWLVAVPSVEGAPDRLQELMVRLVQIMVCSLNQQHVGRQGSEVKGGTHRDI